MKLSLSFFGCEISITILVSRGPKREPNLGKEKGAWWQLTHASSAPPTPLTKKDPPSLDTPGLSFLRIQNQQLFLGISRGRLWVEND